MESSTNEQLYQHLASLGSSNALDVYIDRELVMSELQSFEDSWVRYNPRKEIARWGLSLTSLDGSMTGIPDLDSIREYNLAHDLRLGESNFTTKTLAARKITGLHHVLKYFEGSLGRTHLIKFNEGGFFPPHRDAYAYNPSCFRLLALINNTSPSSFVLQQSDQNCKLDECRLYWFDTRLSHSVFSFVDNAIILVMNIALNQKSVDQVKSLLSSK